MVKTVCVEWSGVIMTLFNLAFLVYQYGQYLIINTARMSLIVCCIKYCRIPCKELFSDNVCLNFSSHGRCSCLQHGKTHIGREDAPNPQDIGESLKRLVT